MFNFPQSDCFLPLKIRWEVVWIKGYSTTFLYCCIFQANLCISLGNDQGHRATHKGGKTFEHEYFAQWYSMLAFLLIYIGNEADSSQVLDLLFLQTPLPTHIFMFNRGLTEALQKAFRSLCQETALVSSLPRSVSVLCIQASAQLLKYPSLLLLYSFPVVTILHIFGAI